MRLTLFKNIEISSIFVVLLWGLMWLLWIPHRQFIPHNRTQSSMSVSLSRFSHPSGKFLMDPLIFEAKSKLQTTEETAGILSRDIHHLTLPPASLERSEASMKESPVLLHQQSVLESFRNYTMASTSSTPGIIAPERSASSVHVQINGELATLGFEIPPFSEEIKKYEGKHQVTLSVNIGDNGRPTSVFVVHSSGDTKFDLMMVRTVLQGRASRSGYPCEGTVTIIHQYP